MSNPRQSIMVSRGYRNAPDACVRALELLLKKSVGKEGGPATAPNSAKGGSDVSSAIQKSTR
jgi:hypothetical protein